MTTDGADEHWATSWTLVQVGALLRSSDELLLECQRIIGPAAHAGFPEDAALALDVDAVETLHTALAELGDLGDRLRVLGDCLPAAPLELRYADLRDAAAEELANGVADPGRALLAARALDLAVGWRALAAGLRAGDDHADWHELTVAHLLRRFRGADASSVGAVLIDAGIDPEATFADCPPEHLDALASALEARAGERR
ncbi:MAG TPA: hypothetical protein VK506_12020 [Conexibacter sp.]|nr:hypothetical protein [Conexibacter sp.]